MRYQVFCLAQFISGWGMHQEMHPRISENENGELLGKSNPPQMFLPFHTSSTAFGGGSAAAHHKPRVLSPEPRVGLLTHHGAILGTLLPFPSPDRTSTLIPTAD